MTLSYTVRREPDALVFDYEGATKQERLNLNDFNALSVRLKKDAENITAADPEFAERALSRACVLLQALRENEADHVKRQPGALDKVKWAIADTHLVFGQNFGFSTRAPIEALAQQCYREAALS